MTIHPPAGPGGRDSAGASGDLVALLFKHGQHMLNALFRCWERGQAVLPLDASLPKASLERIMKRLRPARILSDEGEQALEGEPVAQDTALVITTSGSTGEPKGVELSHAALQWAAEASSSRLAVSAEDRWLCCLPLHHIAGIMVALRARLNGDMPIIQEAFDEKAVTGETRASLVSLVPTTLKRLLDAGADLSRFSVILLGGGPVPAELVDRAAEKGARVVTTYGMTETCGGCVYDGFPLEGVDLRLESERIMIKGPMLFSRYRLNPALTEEALRSGWFRTSDRGRFGPEGRLQVLGRLDDTIVTGGKKVVPQEVEALLSMHPSVREAVVTATPSHEWGEEVAALIVLEPGKSVTLGELKHFIALRAPAWMAPKRIKQVETIPRTEAGKVLRREVSRLLEH